MLSRALARVQSRTLCFPGEGGARAKARDYIGTPKYQAEPMLSAG